MFRSESFQLEAAAVGLRVFWAKTKIQSVSTKVVTFVLPDKPWK